MTLPISTTLLSSQLAARATSLRASVVASANEVANSKPEDIADHAGRQFGRLTSNKADIARLDAYRANGEDFSRRADVKQLALAEIESAAQELLTLASTMLPTQNATQVGTTAIDPTDPVDGNPLYDPAVFQETVNGVLERVLNAFNASDPQGSMFAGVAADGTALADLDEPGPGGLTPQQAFDAQLLASPPVDAVGTAGLITAIDAMFTDTAPVGENFAEAFYLGAPATGPRVATSIDEGVTADFGIQADDPAARELIKGVMMFAAVDLTQIDDASLDDYADAARTALSAGLDGIRIAQAELGQQQNNADAAADRHTAQTLLLRDDVAAIEYSDPIEAQVRYKALEEQLNVTFELIARVSNLSLFDRI